MKSSKQWIENLPVVHCHADSYSFVNLDSVEAIQLDAYRAGMHRATHMIKQWQLLGIENMKVADMMNHEQDPTSS